MGIKLTFTLLHPWTCHVDEKSYYVALFAHFPFDYQLTFLSLVNIGKRNLCRYLSQKKKKKEVIFNTASYSPFPKKSQLGSAIYSPRPSFAVPFLDTLSLPTIDGIPWGCKSSASTPSYHTQSWECFCIGFYRPSLSRSENSVPISA